MSREYIENYMDKFRTPEEFIRHQILAKGNFSCLNKKMLYKMICEHHIDFELNKHNIAYTKKSDLLDAVLKKISYKELAQYVDVSQKSFCIKFEITQEEFNLLVKKDLIHVTNKHFRIKNPNTESQKFGSWCGYNVYDYFSLTKEIVKATLENN